VKALALDPAEVTADRIDGRILSQDFLGIGEYGRVRLGKGRILTADDAPALRTSSRELHLLELQPGDVHEDEASLRLAAAIAGEGLESHGPVESQTHLRAAHRGLVEVRSAALEAINALPDMSVYTVYDGQPVLEGKAVAAAKVTPLAVPDEILRQAEEIARAAQPVVSVRPFLSAAVGVVVRESIEGAAREKFEAALQMKIGWFESPIAGICYVPPEVERIAEAIDSLRRQGVALLLAAGVNSTDPLDLTIQALDRLGARTERRGVPAHPGSTCWLAYLDDLPIFGLALCGMFSQTTALDLLLPRFLAGLPVRAMDIARLGHGGLLSKDMGFRFPAYDGKRRPRE
jgi:hypothetical protein